MPSFEIQADIFTRLSVFDSPKGSSNTFKTQKNVSLYFKRRYLIIYNYFFHSQPLDMHVAHLKIKGIKGNEWMTRAALLLGVPMSYTGSAGPLVSIYNTNFL